MLVNKKTVERENMDPVQPFIFTDKVEIHELEEYLIGLYPMMSRDIGGWG